MTARTRCEGTIAITKPNMQIRIIAVEDQIDLSIVIYVGRDNPVEGDRQIKRGVHMQSTRRTSKILIQCFGPIADN